MVDAADQEKVEASRNELHNLLDKPQLQGIPVSVDLKLFFDDFWSSYTKPPCELQELLPPALSGFFSNVCLGFGSR